ncbi:major capsid pentamer protein [Mycobacterium phage Corofin]|nr:major capsid pentamer protein [Mycobacterium phage Heathcliff]AKG94814.1 major capsid pentamer protein [Mycobacterium phage Corofin]QYW01123.1 major capsid pentamer protein [Mycobacterium phage Yinz]UDG78874.1 minor capsid protein [Mycobacterium phage LestyG]
MTSATALLPIQFDAPLLNPAPVGLLAATSWTDVDGPERHLAGVDINVYNFGGDESFGVWGADWCASPEDLTEDDVKEAADRPAWPDAFEAVTVWARDRCDLTRASRDDVNKRVQQIIRLRLSHAAEREFATRLLADITAPDDVVDIVAAVSELESDLADEGIIGLLHAPVKFAAIAMEKGLAARTTGGILRSPLGHQWVFGAGYRTILGDKIVATSPTFGWRGPIHLRDNIHFEHNVYNAIAEQTLVIGYEDLISAVDVVGAPDPEPEP